MFKKICYVSLISFLLNLSTVFAEVNQKKRFFTEIDPPIHQKNNTKKIELVKIFSYECRACKNFEIKFSKWLDKHGHDLVINHLPLSILPKNFKENLLDKDDKRNTAKEIGKLPRLCYSLMAIDKNIFSKYPLLNQKIFDQVLVGENMLFNSDFLNEEVQAAFLEKEFAFDKQQFLTSFRNKKDFYIDTQIKHNEVLMKKLRLTSVPAILVSGKWLVTPREDAESMEEMLENMFETVEELVQKIKKSSLTQ